MEFFTHSHQKLSNRTIMRLNLITLLFILFNSQVYAGKNFYLQLSNSALELTHQKVLYDPQYYTISYPNGDIPPNKGVCTDVIIRAYRKLGIDLQKEVHEDMVANFSKYPRRWGLSYPDKNIDHRRVPNLMVFFTRHGQVNAITKNPMDYLPGDIVCWDLGGGITHIGLMTHKLSADGKRFQLVHNIGSGQVMQDCLFEYRIIGHYRYQK